MKYVKSRCRPLTEDQLIDVLAARWRGEKEPQYCPICGHVGLFWLKEEHEFGSTFVVEDLGFECENCGRIWECADCGGWHSEGAEEWGLSGDCIPYLCSCSISSASTYDPGTLTS